MSGTTQIPFFERGTRKRPFPFKKSSLLADDDEDDEVSQQGALAGEVISFNWF